MQAGGEQRAVEAVLSASALEGKSRAREIIYGLAMDSTCV